MLFVSSIERINRFQRRAIICDTASEFMTEIIYGDGCGVSDAWIRMMAPSLVTNKPKKRGITNGKNHRNN